MHSQSRKVVLVGTGMVGMSYAYALLNQNACDELLLIDIDAARAEGEAMDLSHGLAFSPGHMRIATGQYADCADADIVVLCAGVAQKPGEERPALLARNAEVFRSIVEPVVRSGFSGIFLVATNPVDVMTRLTQALSGFAPGRVVGTGTALDTARLRYLLGEYFCVDPRNVHAYVMGEHGESEFVPWSQAMLATKPVFTVCEESGGRFRAGDMEGLADRVRCAAQQIIAAKRATYYGIGMAMARITRALLGDENSVLTVSTLLRGAHGVRGVFAGIPCVVGGAGVRETLTLPLLPEEEERFRRSCEVLDACWKELSF